MGVWDSFNSTNGRQGDKKHELEQKSALAGVGETGFLQEDAQAEEQENRDQMIEGRRHDSHRGAYNSV